VLFAKPNLENATAVAAVDAAFMESALLVVSSAIILEYRVDF
jgi:hypothetical protein